MILPMKAGDTTLMHELYRTAWHECLELQARPLEEALQSVTREVQDYPRAEIYTEDMSGGMILVASEDMHVGYCATVFWAYVHPAARNAQYRRLFRQALEVASRWGCPFIAYSHRVGVGEFIHKYRRVQDGQSRIIGNGCFRADRFQCCRTSSRGSQASTETGPADAAGARRSRKREPCP